ncbi:MAG: hypothetical protein R6U40_03730 [Desulfobacterales bacterium]
MLEVRKKVSGFRFQEWKGGSRRKENRGKRIEEREKGKEERGKRKEKRE